MIYAIRKMALMNVTRQISVVNGFSTALAVLHLVTLTIKDGSLHGRDHLAQHVGIKGSWAFTVNCCDSSSYVAETMYCGLRP